MCHLRQSDWWLLRLTVEAEFDTFTLGNLRQYANNFRNRQIEGHEDRILDGAQLELDLIVGQITRAYGDPQR